MSESFDYNAPTAPQARRPPGSPYVQPQQPYQPPQHQQQHPLQHQQPQQHPQQQWQPQPPPERPPGRSKAMDYTLKGLGLVLVAVLSGVLWWVFRQDGSASPQKPPGNATTSSYQFTPYHNPVTDPNCPAYATASVKAFLSQHACQQVSRSLYTTQLPGGAQVLVGVAVVRMGTAADASGLDAVSNGSNTGHVRDLVEDKTAAVPGGPTSLERGGYASAASGATEVIAVTEFFDNAKDTTANLTSSQSTLRAVAQAAVQQLGNSS